ncbi:MAG TPA: GAF domain-containing protein, partial [Chloroflexaceae bacterium]|nr:GAF domain-containing protein [Chloroflexaceae bacterium]
MTIVSRPEASLLGALLVAEELVTQEQLDACLMLQRQDHPDLPIGEVLLRYGYLSRSELEAALVMQRSIRDSLIARVDTQGPPLPDLRALLLTAGEAPALAHFLRGSGVAVDYLGRAAAAGTRPPYDLTLVAPERLGALAGVPHRDALVGLLPEGPADGAGLSEATRALVGRYVEQARAAMDNRAELEQQRHHQYELAMIEQLIRDVAGAPTPQDALLRLMMIIRDLVAVEAATLYRLDGDTSSLVFEIVLGKYQMELTHQRIPITQGVAGWVARHGEPLIIPDVRQDPRFSAAFDSKTGFQTQAMLCVPMQALGRTQGVLQLINKLDGRFDEHDLLLLRLTA